MPSVDAELKLSPRHLKLLQELLQAHAPQAQVWAYGSRVSGGAHEGSDLDLVLRNPVDPAAGCQQTEALREALQDSLLPILVDLHDWAQLPADFRHNILQQHVELQSGHSGG